MGEIFADELQEALLFGHDQRDFLSLNTKKKGVGFGGVIVGDWVVGGVCDETDHESRRAHTTPFALPFWAV